MKKCTWTLAIITVVEMAFLLYLPSTGYSGNTSVSIGINAPPLSIGINTPPALVVPAPPPLVISAPPPVVVIPGTYVYAAPTVGADILFYNGYWYRPYDRYWYRARHYRGPWAHVAPAAVPGVLFNVSHYDYRHAPRERHIPYGQFKKHWRQWGKEKHWDHHHD